MAETLTPHTVDERLSGSPWTREGDAITLQRSFADFKAAIAFVNRVADVAEAANHHPDITVHGWNKVRLVLSTHSAGGITEADLQMAGRLDELD